MAGLCLSPDADAGLVQSLLGSVDCNVQAMAEAGYGALSRPGSPIAAALTILLTLYIAVMGLRLMLGHAPLRIGDLTLSVLKIGLILTLATSWPTYQQVVFDILIKGPEQLGATFLQGLGTAGGSTASPMSGLQVAYDQLQAGAVYFNQRATPSMSPLQGGPGFAAFALNLSALFLILTTLGVMLTAKIVLALLLGLGPVFIAFFLFDATRGLFEGWLRAAIGFAFLPMLAILGLVVQLILLGPQLQRMAELQAGKSLDLGPASAIFLLSLIFVMVNAALIAAGGIMAAGLRLPSRRTQLSAGIASQSAGQLPAVAPAMSSPAAVRQPPDRAAHIAMAASALERRDGRSISGPHATVQTGPAPGARQTHQDGPLRGAGTPSTYRRSAQPRRAASTMRRDK